MTVPCTPTQSPRSSCLMASNAVVADDRLRDEQLHLAVAVANGGEHELARVAQQHDAAGDGDGIVGLGARLELAARGADLGERVGAVEPVRVRVRRRRSRCRRASQPPGLLGRQPAPGVRRRQVVVGGGRWWFGMSVLTVPRRYRNRAAMCAARLARGAPYGRRRPYEFSVVRPRVRPSVSRRSLVLAVGLPVAASRWIDRDRARARRPSGRRRARRTRSRATSSASSTSGDLRPTWPTLRSASPPGQAGAAIAFGRSASVGMVGRLPGERPVQLPRPGSPFPMGTTVLPPEAVGAVMGRDVAALLAPSGGHGRHDRGPARCAGRRRARARRESAGRRHPVPDRRGAPPTTSRRHRAVMSPPAADRLGISDRAGRCLWNPSSQAAIDAGARRQRARVAIRSAIRRSWDPPNPDGTLGMAQTKVLLGEFELSGQCTTDRSAMNAAWVAANLPAGSWAAERRRFRSAPAATTCIDADLAGGARRGRRGRARRHDRRRQRQHLRRLLQPARFNVDRRQLARLPVPARLGDGARHEHHVELPGACPPTSQPDRRVPHRADLPQATASRGVATS